MPLVILLALLACPVDVSADMNARPPSVAEANASAQSAGTSAPVGDAPAAGQPFVPPSPASAPQGPPLGPDGKVLPTPR